eukprot:scaffold213493_cov21-Tisochrysis_lutea.AAC.2
MMVVMMMTCKPFIPFISEPGKARCRPCYASSNDCISAFKLHRLTKRVQCEDALNERSAHHLRHSGMATPAPTPQRLE